MWFITTTRTDQNQNLNIAYKDEDGDDDDDDEKDENETLPINSPGYKTITISKFLFEKRLIRRQTVAHNMQKTAKSLNNVLSLSHSETLNVQFGIHP